MALMSEFGEYLRRRRAELQPADVGLPDTAFRRVTGLRREEVAQLAGVSTDYYTRLEQGRDLSPSDAVLDALARALELDDAGRAHLQHLAHPARPARRQARTVQRVRPTVQSMLDAWTSHPAFVLGRRGDVLATNALARALLADFDAMPYRDRNLTRWILLDPAARELYVDWAQIASEMVAILRLDAGAHPDDPRTTELVGELTLKSPEFPRWWSQHKVLDRTWGHKRFRHPVVGALEIDYEALHLPGDIRRFSSIARRTATRPPPKPSPFLPAGMRVPPPANRLPTSLQVRFMPADPDFATFGHAEAWRLGQALVEQCRAENLPVTITITLGEQRVFHAALPGTSADNDDWALRKIRVVRRFDRSSHDVGETCAAADPVLFHTMFGLPPADYAPTGGAVPIRIRGTQVGVLAISGLASTEDHERALRALQDAATPTDTTLRPSPDLRSLQPGQRSQIWLGGPDLDVPQLLFETDRILLEAPNWTQDGTALVLNGAGRLWTLDVVDPSNGPQEIAFVDLPALNNDHVLDPDGAHVYMSAMDTHIYRGRLTGGAVERVSPDDGRWHFLHGVSPDGARLAYVQIDQLADPGRLAILQPDGSVRVVDVGPGHLDGPEWSPDGHWIYLNTEAFTQAPGHAQLARVGDADGRVERLVVSDTVDWFPHLSPDAAHASYVAFPPGTRGHPADVEVEVRVVSTADWSTPLQRYPLFGGQGTLNVNSWSPDATRFAFVAYPFG